MLDFYCSTASLCIEVDGASHGFGDRPQRDQRRDEYLRSLGIEVVRIAATAVLDDPDSIAEWIRHLARERIDRQHGA